MFIISSSRRYSLSSRSFAGLWGSSYPDFVSLIPLWYCVLVDCQYVDTTINSYPMHLILDLPASLLLHRHLSAIRTIEEFARIDEVVSSRLQSYDQPYHTDELRMPISSHNMFPPTFRLSNCLYIELSTIANQMLLIVNDTERGCTNLQMQNLLSDLPEHHRSQGSRSSCH